MSTFNFNHMFLLADVICKISNVFQYSGSSSIAPFFKSYAITQFWRGNSWDLLLDLKPGLASS